MTVTRIDLPGGRRFTFTYARLQSCIGVNSKVGEDRHVILWDFDNVPWSELEPILLEQINKHKLSTIHVYKSRADGDNWHCFCLSVRPFTEVVSIIATTPRIDWTHFKWGVMRGFFTLRIGRKVEAIPFLYALLPSSHRADITWSQLPSFVYYETLVKGKVGK